VPFANEYVGFMRENYRDAVQYGHFLAGFPIHAGNCVEYASVAAFYLSKAGIGQVIQVEMLFPGGHYFVLAAESADHIPATSRLPLLYTDRSSTWAVDPWANICCPLRDYTREFAAKMIKWHLRGKILCSPVKYAGPPIWSSPMDYFLDAAMNCELDYSLPRHSATRDGRLVRRAIPGSTLALRPSSDRLPAEPPPIPPQPKRDATASKPHAGKPD